MRQLKTIYPFLLLLLLVSCKKDFFESVVEVDVPIHSSQLTVGAHFYDQIEAERYIVDVGHSVGIVDSTSITAVTDAVLELLEDGKVIVDSFELYVSKNLKNSLYFTETPISFSPDKTYTLQVSSPEYGQLKGTQKLPTKVLIEHATYKKESVIDRWGDRGDEISLQFSDPANEQNYYEVRVLAEIAVTSAKESSLRGINLVTRNTPVDPLPEEVGSKLLLSDVGFDGTTYTLKLANSTSREIRNLQRLGGRLEGAEVMLKSIGISLLSVSKDYYIFHKSLDNYKNNKDNFFAEPINVYENIEGGIGIFTLSTGDDFKIEF